MQEILPGILTWPWFSERHGYNFNGYLVCAAEGNICIDPVELDAPMLDAVAHRGVKHIVITNRNHMRAANVVRARTGARSAIHPADAAYAREQGAIIDGDLQVGQHVGPLVVIGVSGKSPGEVAFHWPEQRLLVVGDAVIGNPPGHCRLLPDRVVDDPPRLQASVRRLLDLDFDTLLVGDGSCITKGARDRLRELAETFGA
jgi:glyoxylase-like metal-dependent hydrolase (beta-lactamase superfamily II)